MPFLPDLLDNFINFGQFTDEKYSKTGDYFGGILNPILAFLSLVALLYTIILQTSSIKLQTKELEQTRIELRESKKAQEEQVKSLNEQVNIAKRQSVKADSHRLEDLFRLENKTKQDYRLSNDKQKRDLTLRLYEKWTGDELMNARVSASRHMGKDKKVYIKHLIENDSVENRELLRNLVEIYQFLSSLKKLISETALDTDLTYLLFEDSTYIWCVLGNNIKFGKNIFYRQFFGCESWYADEPKELLQWFKDRKGI